MVSQRLNGSTNTMVKYIYNKDELKYEVYNGRRGIGFAAILMVSLFTITSFRAGKPVMLKEKVYVDSYENYEGHFLYNEIKSKNKDAFILHIKSIGKRTDIPYQDLMAWSYFESGLDYKAQNKAEPFDDGTYATGLIQWTPISRKAMGVTYQELLDMDEFEQLELMCKYIKMHKKEIKCFSDLYLLGYLPGYMSASDDTPIPDKYYQRNKSIGRTIGEFRMIVNKKYSRLIAKK